MRAQPYPVGGMQAAMMIWMQVISCFQVQFAPHGSFTILSLPAASLIAHTHHSPDSASTKRARAGYTGCERATLDFETDVCSHLQGAHLCVQAYPNCVRIFAVQGARHCTSCQCWMHWLVVGRACAPTALLHDCMRYQKLTGLGVLAEAVALEAGQPSSEALILRGTQVLILL